ncbi:hypothetical protein OG426_34590 [Streptomyces canus]|uniref:hypothetical protein n=1 Tax=Streptomyces canus TaxID=58343 RepID=UPI00386E74C4|nr:hypothetical protein OG426_34590 [Streptomyces canus]
MADRGETDAGEGQRGQGRDQAAVQQGDTEQDRADDVRGNEVAIRSFTKASSLTPSAIRTPATPRTCEA